MVVGIMVGCMLSATVAKPPHIMFFVIDDLGWNDVGFQRGAVPNQTNAIDTPHLDELAAGGVRLTDYAVFKFCSPSRSQFLTGRYAYHMGQQTTINLPTNVAKPCGLPLGYHMLPRVLRQHTDYVSRAYGKWHQGYFNASYTPVGRGFDSFFGFYDGGQSYYTHITPYSVWTDPSVPLWWTPTNFGCTGCGANASGWPLPPDKLHDGCGALVDLADDIDSVAADGRHTPVLRHAAATFNGTHSTDLIAARVVADIETHDVSRPLFAYVAWHAVHDPLQVQRSYEERYAGVIQDASRRRLAGMVSHVDEGMANITAALKAAGMWEDTLVVVTTDNGGPVCLNMSAGTQRGEQSGSDCGTNNWPLRGSKMTLWEGGVRGVGFVGGPRVPASRRGTVWGGMMHSTDWYPALLRMAGVDDAIVANATGPLPPDGVGGVLDAVLKGGPSPRTEMVHNIDEGGATAMHVGSIRVGDWKLLKGYPGCTAQDKPGGIKGGCYNGVDFRWKPPEMTQPSVDRGEPFVSPPPCSTQPCLFNVKDDPGEQLDLAARQPEKLRQLLQRYDALQESEVTLEAAQLCPVEAGVGSGCRANLGSGVWSPWL